MNQHVGILLVVCVAFVALLLYAFIRSSIFQTNFRNDVRRLRKDIEQSSGSGLPNWVGLPSWLGPFVCATNNSFHLTQARDVASRQLEESLAAQRDFLKLQKFLTAAPLLGVLLTAIGFITVEANLNDVKSLAVPLVGGVATGASLALFCQFLLYRVELDSDKSRCDGQALIDEIWVLAIKHIGDPHRSILNAVGKLESATASLTVALGDFPERLPVLTRKFSEIHDVSRETFAVLADIIPQLKSTASDWQTASMILKESTEKEIMPSYKSLSDSTQQLQSASGEFTSMTKTLQIAIEGLSIANTEQKSLHATLLEASKNEVERHNTNMSQHARELEESQKHLMTSVLDSLTPQLQQIGQTIATHLDVIQSGTEGIRGPLKETADCLSAAAPGLKSSSDILLLMGKAARDFSETISHSILPSYSSLKMFDSLAKEMDKSVTRLASSLDSISSASQAGQQFSELIKRRALPTVEVLQRATGSFEDSVNLLSECTRELSSVLDELARRNLIPVTKQVEKQDE